MRTTVTKSGTLAAIALLVCCFVSTDVLAQADGQTSVVAVERATTVTTGVAADGQVEVDRVEILNTRDDSKIADDQKDAKQAATKAQNGRTFSSIEKRKLELKKIQESQKAVNVSRAESEDRQARISEYYKSQGETESVVYPDEAELKRLKQERASQATKSTPNK